MYLRFHAQSSKSTYTMFHRGLSLLISILLLAGTIRTQDTRKTQEDETVRLMSEGLQLVKEGSPASLTKAIDKLDSARGLLHTLNFPEGEAMMLFLTGFAYGQLKQDQKAI